jgi:membrane-associated phospholipid phosphatase
VAAGRAAAAGAWLGWRALGAVLVPLAALMSIGTVYGQFHYAVDALAGAAVAAALVAIDRWPGRSGTAAPL